ncbi:MAG: DUF1178 family protein [Deltaproteobacteria bacterium]|nr:DUF1178 family protein [Deltaproteobacteria bacterium]
MIVFDLECSQGHRFEGWFESMESFEEQNKKKMINCPYCDETNVRKVLSPITTKTRSTPMEAKDLSAIDYRRLAKEFMDYVNEGFEDLGTDFTREALKIHYGVAERRNIKGSATLDEEKILQDEGVQYFKVPIPKPDDKKDKTS